MIIPLRPLQTLDFIGESEAGILQITTNNKPSGSEPSLQLEALGLSPYLVLPDVCEHQACIRIQLNADKVLRTVFTAYHR